MSSSQSDEETRLQSWLVAASGIPSKGVSLSQYLHSGIVLCKLANVIQPGAVPKISTLPSAYAQMENIKKFCDFLRFQLRLRDADLFVTVDLFEEKNVKQVTHCLLQLAVFIRTLPSYHGPHLVGDVKSAYQKSSEAPTSSLSSNVPRTIVFGALEEGDRKTVESPSRSSTGSDIPASASRPSSASTTGRVSVSAPNRAPPSIPNLASRRPTAVDAPTSQAGQRKESTASALPQANGHASQMLAAVAPHVHRKSIINTTAAKAAIAVAAYAATTANTAAAPSSAAVAAAASTLTPSTTSVASSSSSSSSSSTVIALDPMKVWSTLTTLSGDLYTINSSLRELQLTDQHKSHALSILQQMIKMQDGKNEAFRSELQQARKDISALTTTLSKQAAAQAALASAAPEVSAGDFSRLSQDFTRQSAESARQKALLQKELEQLRLALQQTASEHAHSLAQLSASAHGHAQAIVDEEERLKKRADHHEQGNSTMSAEVDALQLQLSSLRAQQAQQVQMSSNATLLQTRDMHELKSTVQILQNSLTALAASQACMPAPLPVAPAPPTVDPEVAAQLASLQGELAKTKKQNLALREALIKLNKRVDEAKEAMDTSVASLTLTVQCHAASAVAASSSSSSSVSSEDFSSLRKSVHASRKGLKHVEDTIEVLSSVVEATGADQMRALERLRQEQQAIKEEIAAASRTAKEVSETRAQEVKDARELHQKELREAEKRKAGEDEMLSVRLEQMELELEKKIAEVRQQLSSSSPLPTMTTSTGSVSSPSTVEVALDSSAAVQSLQSQLASLQSEVHTSHKSLEVSLLASLKSATVETNVRLETELAKMKEHIDAVHTASTDWETRFACDIEGLHTEVATLSVSVDDSASKQAASSDESTRIRGDVEWLREKLVDLQNTNLGASLQEDFRELRLQSQREGEALEKRFEAIGEQIEETKSAVESELAGQIAAVKAMIPASDSSTLTALTSTVRQVESSLRQVEASLSVVKDLSDHTSKRVDSTVASVREQMDFTTKRTEEHRKQDAEAVRELERRLEALKAQQASVMSQPHSKRGSGTAASDAMSSDAASVPVTSAILPAVEAAISRRSSLLASSPASAATAPIQEEAGKVDARGEASDSVSDLSGSTTHHRASIAVLRDRNESTASIDEYAGRSSQPSVSMANPPETRSAQLSVSDIPEEGRSTATSVSSTAGGGGSGAAPGHNHRASSAELLARKYADEMARMRREFEERLEGERLATEAAQLLLQKKRESVIAAGHSNRSSVDLTSATGSFTSFRDRASSTDSAPRTARSSRKGSTLSANGDRSLAGGSSGAHFLGSEDVVEEGDEVEDGEDAEEMETSSEDFLSSSASNGNLFGLDSPSAKKKSSISEPSPSATSAAAAAAAALPTMATYEMQLAAMKAEYERKVAEEREMTLQRKAILLHRRDTMTASSPSSASNSVSSRPPFVFVPSTASPKYTPMVVEETLTEEAFHAGVAAETADPAQAYYAATVAEGPSEILKHRMLPLINASRRNMSLAEVGEQEAVRLQANLSIMRETMLGRRKAIEENSDSEDSDLED